MASGVRAIPLPNQAGTDAAIQVSPAGGTGLILFGWSLYENAGSPALASAFLRVTSAAGAKLAAIKVPASGESKFWMGPQGLYVPGDLWIDFIAGSMDGTIFVG